MKKNWYQSKAMWGGAFLVLIGAYQIVTTGTIDPIAATQVLTGLGIIGIRDAQA